MSEKVQNGYVLKDFPATSSFSMDEDGKEKAPVRVQVTEREISAQLLGSFVVQGSRGLTFLESVFQKKPTKYRRADLVLIGRFYAALLGEKFGRNWTRSKWLVVKWFDDHYDSLMSLGPIIKEEAYDADQL